MKKLGLLTLLPLVLSIGGCNNNQNNKKDHLQSWNECNALKVLKAYVEDVTNEKSKNFIPVKDRIATFDMDGTFVGELYPSYFEYNMLE